MPATITVVNNQTIISVGENTAESARYAGIAVTAAEQAEESADRATAFLIEGYESDLCGYVYAVIGENGEFVFGSTTSGETVFNDISGGTVSGDIGVFASYLLGSSEVTPLDGYEADLCGASFILVDTDLRPVIGASDTTVDAGRYETAVNDEGDVVWLDVDGDGNRQVSAYDPDSAQIVALTTENDNAGIAVAPGRRVIYTTVQSGVATRYWKHTTGGDEWPFLPNNQITVWGDSLGASGSGIGATLGTALPDRTVNREAIGGQAERAILDRQNIATTATVAGDSVPTTGSVILTGLNLLDGPGGDRSVNLRIFGIDGSHVDGLLTKTTPVSDSVYTFVRDVDGTAMTVPNPATILVISGLSADYRPMSSILCGTAILIAGRNDIGTVGFDINVLEAMDREWVANLRTMVKRPLICGVYNAPSDGATTQNYVDALAINEMRREVWGDWQDGGIFVDWEAAIVAAGQADIVNVGGTDYYRAKSSFVSDGLHPDDAVGKPILTTITADAITGKGF